MQSVVVRLIVECEEEIKNFKQTSAFRVTAIFTFTIDNREYSLSAELPYRFETEEDAHAFLQNCKEASYKIKAVEKKPISKLPAPPFTTSTLQQEAGRKLGFSVSNTMRIAQQLYESGKITYMRTDSVNLSQFALMSAKKEIENLYGTEYVKNRQFSTKSKGAQEAHEAIRPTYLDQQTIKGTADERKLYELIWKRTVASQMSDARVLKTDIKVSSDKGEEKFNVQATQVLFDGFLKLYIESTDDPQQDDDSVILPEMHIGDKMTENGITAECKYTSAPSRYTDASLIKKLEELEIGRPSTYAPTITTLTKARGYVAKGDKSGVKHTVTNLTLKNGRIKTSTKTETVGAEKNRLLPQDIGMIVTDYLVKNFPQILDYKFTANVEEDFDRIA